MDPFLATYVRWQEAAGALATRALRPSPGQRGAGILEYCLIIGLIAVAIVTVMTQFTGAISGVFARIIGRLGAVG